MQSALPEQPAVTSLHAKRCCVSCSFTAESTAQPSVLLCWLCSWRASTSQGARSAAPQSSALRLGPCWALLSFWGLWCLHASAGGRARAQNKRECRISASHSA